MVGGVGARHYHFSFRHSFTKTIGVQLNNSRLFGEKRVLTREVFITGQKS